MQINTPKSRCNIYFAKRASEYQVFMEETQSNVLLLFSLKNNGDLIFKSNKDPRSCGGSISSKQWGSILNRSEKQTYCIEVIIA